MVLRFLAQISLKRTDFRQWGACNGQRVAGSCEGHGLKHHRTLDKEQNEAGKEKDGTKRKSSSDSEPDDSKSKKKRDAADKPRGLAGGLDPERVTGAADSSGGFTFLTEWKDSDEADLVLAKEANMKCPQTVIAFYEERLPSPSCPEDEAQ
ncbi:hypothetical protein E2I00_001392 [Balaenoptera physalus]|uniref:Chromo domain-containing protein n=1 Tax=Balaenoptera physalus TaxID=9770 RepID=A0A6A1Q186_BALPH|nr:hypothetical protein E2I00_001392 [Balaenoptera physalus]